MFSGNALNLAVFFEREQKVSLLLNYGAIAGRTALHLASMDGNTRIIAMLLEAFSNPELKSAAAKSAATTARQNGHIAAAEMLEAAARE